MKQIGFLLLLTTIGCASAPTRDYRFIEIPSEINKNPAKVLSQKDVAADIEQAVYALENAYSGSRHLPTGEFKTLVEGVHSIQGPLSAQELCKRIDHLMDQVSDNHLTAKLNDKPCFPNEQKTKGSVGANFYKEKDGVSWAVRLDKKKKKTALLISIAGFPKSTSPIWNGFIDQVKQALPKADFVILDMRGNGGGDDSKGIELSNLLAGVNLKSPYGPQWNSFKPETYQVFVNTFEYWARIRREKGEEVPPYIAQLKIDFIKKRDLALKGERPRLGDDETQAPEQEFVYEKSIKKPIYILIDAECASSCESATDFFEYNPLVKTVGQNTAGYVHFGNNGNVFLNNSGTSLQMAISYNSYRDGRFIEKKGITPKIRVPSGQDAMKAAWEDFEKSSAKR